MPAIQAYRSPRIAAGFQHPLFRLSDSMRYTSWLPALDLSETDEAFKVVLEVPGVKPEDLEVTFEGGNLVVRGEKRNEQVTDERGYRRVERSYGGFERAVRLGAPVDSDQVQAECHDGVLTVTLPKAPEARPRQITING